MLGPGRARDIAADDALEGHGGGAARQHRAAVQRVTVRSERRHTRDDFVGVGRQEVMRHDGFEALEPECTQLGEYGALEGHRFAHDDVECAHAITGDKQQRALVDLVHLPNLPATQEREGQLALHQYSSGHT